MKQSALESVFTFWGRVIGLGNYKSSMIDAVVELSNIEIHEHCMLKW